MPYENLCDESKSFPWKIVLAFGENGIPGSRDRK